MIRIKKISNNTIKVEIVGNKHDIADELLYFVDNFDKIIENIYHTEFKQLDKKYKYNRKF